MAFARSLKTCHIPVTYPYLPGPERPLNDIFGRLLPQLPSQTPPPASNVYGVNTILSLARPAGGKRTETVIIRVVKHLELGYCLFSQSLLAYVESGPTYLAGRTVFVKVYDPWYINPDDLRAIAPSEENPRRNSSRSDASMEGETLAGSVELSRTSLLSEQMRATKLATEEMGESVCGPTSEPNQKQNQGVATESRGAGAERHFRNELRAYMQLSAMQGKEIAKFLGHFILQFPNRELQEDQNCRVLILEALKGKVLANMSAQKLAGDKYQRIREQVLNIVKRVQEDDIYFPALYLDKFLILTENADVRLFGFGNTFNPKDLYDTPKERELHAKVTTETLEDLLEDMGLGTSGDL